MKTKKIAKKLALKKTTISNLDFNQMQVARGGDLSEGGTCTDCVSVCLNKCEIPDKTIQSYMTCPYPFCTHTCNGCTQTEAATCPTGC